MNTAQEARRASTPKLTVAADMAPLAETEQAPLLMVVVTTLVLVAMRQVADWVETPTQVASLPTVHWLHDMPLLVLREPH